MRRTHRRIDAGPGPLVRAMTQMMRVVLAQPRGFCAGVERAIEIVERALEKYGPPIYVRHEIVHNRHVVERLRAKGAQFVDEIDEVPPGSVTIFSAHGVASEIEQRAIAASYRYLAGQNTLDSTKVENCFAAEGKCAIDGF